MVLGHYVHHQEDELLRARLPLPDFRSKDSAPRFLGHNFIRQGFNGPSFFLPPLYSLAASLFDPIVALLLNLCFNLNLP